MSWRGQGPWLELPVLVSQLWPSWLRTRIEMVRCLFRIFRGRERKGRGRGIEKENYYYSVSRGRIHQKVKL
jgi:hypothetical protein